MHARTILAGAVAVILGFHTSFAGNAVLVESRAVPAAADNITIGIYITNEVELGALVIPLVIREVTPGSFIADTLILTAANRLADHITGYVVRSYLPAEDNPRYWECQGGGFSTRGLPDFVSPDAMMYAAVIGDQEPCLPAGNDGAPPGGAPSLRVTFGVTGAVGTFEIDTTCITPANHLLFAGCGSPLYGVVPSFTRGVVEIGGPFWAADSITGHIQSNVTIIDDVVVKGDLTIDSGVTLTLVRGSSLRAIANQDDQHGGIDTQKVEIIINGTLAFDPSPGARPILASTTGLTGTWYGIRVMPGGRIETGIGAVIENAVTGVTLDRAARPETLTGLTIRDCSSAGVVTRSDSVALVGDTVLRVWPGRGIEIDSASPAITGCFIDSCQYGIYTRLSSSRLTGNRIDGPGVYGVYVASGALSEVSDTLRLVHDTVYGHFSQAQMFVGTVNLCRIDSCGFISDLSGTRSPTGITASMSNVRLRRTTIKDFTTNGYYSQLSSSDLGLDKPEDGPIADWGYNVISADTTNCPGCLLRRVYNSNPRNTVSADGNWWGSSSPLASWFSGPVDWTPYLSSPPAGKLAIPEDEAVVAVVPSSYSVSQNYPNPFNASTVIEFSLPTSQMVKVTVYNILGQVAQTLADREYTEGIHRVVWDGTNKDGNAVASGIYLYRIVAGDFTQSKKMVLLK